MLHGKIVHAVQTNCNCFFDWDNAKKYVNSLEIAGKNRIIHQTPIYTRQKDKECFCSVNGQSRIAFFPGMYYDKLEIELNGSTLPGEKENIP